MSESVPVHVAVGVILDANHNVLIALRHPDSHQGGLWEFPGGKLESGEDVWTALVRELEEELNLTPLSGTPLLKVEHNYADKSVLLDVWVVSEFSGEAIGKEGQPIKWVSAGELQQIDFPVANQPIVEAVQQLAR